MISVTALNHLLAATCILGGQGMQETGQQAGVRGFVAHLTEVRGAQSRPAPKAPGRPAPKAPEGRLHFGLADASTSLSLSNGVVIARVRELRELQGSAADCSRPPTKSKLGIFCRSVCSARGGREDGKALGEWCRNLKVPRCKALGEWCRNLKVPRCCFSACRSVCSARGGREDGKALGEWCRNLKGRCLKSRPQPELDSDFVVTKRSDITAITLRSTQGVSSHRFQKFIYGFLSPVRCLFYLRVNLPVGRWGGCIYWALTLLIAAVLALITYLLAVHLSSVPDDEAKAISKDVKHWQNYQARKINASWSHKLWQCLRLEFGFEYSDVSYKNMPTEKPVMTNVWSVRTDTQIDISSFDSWLTKLLTGVVGYIAIVILLVYKLNKCYFGDVPDFGNIMVFGIGKVLMVFRVVASMVLSKFMASKGGKPNEALADQVGMFVMSETGLILVQFIFMFIIAGCGADFKPETVPEVAAHYQIIWADNIFKTVISLVVMVIFSSKESAKDSFVVGWFVRHAITFSDGLNQLSTGQLIMHASLWHAGLDVAQTAVSIFTKYGATFLRERMFSGQNRISPFFCSSDPATVLRNAEACFDMEDNFFTPIAATAFWEALGNHELEGDQEKLKFNWLLEGLQSVYNRSVENAAMLELYRAQNEFESK